VLRELADELRQRALADQQVRAAPDKTPADFDRWRAVDRENLAWLKAAINRYGWPGRSLVGEQGAVDAWLLAQHADHDPDFQRRCVPLLAAAVADGQAPAWQVAYLTDRARLNNGQPQTYGTQYEKLPDGRWARRPVADAEHVDGRRAAVGLEPTTEYEQKIVAMHGAGFLAANP
jgi:hypothetical protein